jgi:hypothetical protein
MELILKLFSRRSTRSPLIGTHLILSPAPWATIEVIVVTRTEVELLHIIINTCTLFNDDKLLLSSQHDLSVC